MQTGHAASRIDPTTDDISLTDDIVASICNVLAALDRELISAAAALLENGLREGRTILLLGNGGSCATASHLATDLMLVAREAKLRATIRSLNGDAPLLSALANDYGFAESGTVLIETNASAGDILVVFSCSARSANVLHAAQSAARLGMTTLLVGSSIAPDNFPAHLTIRIASSHYSVIETAHLAVSHLIIDLARRRLGVESPRCSRQHLLRARAAN